MSTITGLTSTKDPERYQGHGNLELEPAEIALLSATGFERWGNHGWVRFSEDGSEQGGTCYDDRWAMAEALSLAR